MELYQLKYFLYAAKYENISKAAQALRVSQPSISRAVVALEKELQVELEGHGFHVVAGAGVPTEHVFSAKLAPGRPNGDDLAGLEAFGRLRQDRLEPEDSEVEKMLQGGGEGHLRRVQETG